MSPALIPKKFLKTIGLEYFAESLRNFRGQLDGMPELYFEPLSRRSAECRLFTDMEIQHLMKIVNAKPPHSRKLQAR